MNPIIEIVPFSNTWFVGLFLVLCISTLIIQFAIRVPPDTRRILSSTLGIVLICRELWKNWYIWTKFVKFCVDLYFRLLNIFWWFFVQIKFEYRDAIELSKTGWTSKVASNFFQEWRGFGDKCFEFWASTYFWKRSNTFLPMISHWKKLE